jgi:RimJ/RimL family protein N-acetyltransferase
VSLTVDRDNDRAIRCYEKCGFVREGVLRAHRLRFGQPIDMIVMGILCAERFSAA